MHPHLISIGPLTLHTYGLFVAIGFIAGLSLALRQDKKEGLEREAILDLGFYILTAAIIGSRIFYVAVNYSYYLENPVEALKIWRGGLIFYGGFIPAFAVMAYYLKKHQLPLWKVTDVFAPSLALGQSLGRIGCFFAGCCYGKVCDLPWAVTFTDPKSLAPTGIPLHPTQLYEALVTFMIFLVLLWMGKDKKFDGQVAGVYVFLYSISRIATEQFRGDPKIALPEGFLSVSQWIAATLIALSVGMLFYLGRRKPRQPPG